MITAAPSGGALTLPRLSYGVADAEIATGLRRTFLYEEMKAGRLKYLKAGKRRLIREEDLRAFLAALVSAD